jgi:hypothetical protein
MKLLVAASGGMPLPGISVTVQTTVFVEGLCVWAGVQLMVPLLGVIVMPAGMEARAKVNV